MIDRVGDAGPPSSKKIRPGWLVVGITDIINNNDAYGFVQRVRRLWMMLVPLLFNVARHNTFCKVSDRPTDRE
jgi:hypothetical protein